MYFLLWIVLFNVKSQITELMPESKQQIHCQCVNINSTSSFCVTSISSFIYDPISNSKKNEKTITRATNLSPWVSLTKSASNEIIAYVGSDLLYYDFDGNLTNNRTNFYFNHTYAKDPDLPILHTLISSKNGDLIFCYSTNNETDYYFTYLVLTSSNDIYPDTSSSLMFKAFKHNENQTFCFLINKTNINAYLYYYIKLDRVKKILLNTFNIPGIINIAACKFENGSDIFYFFCFIVSEFPWTCVKFGKYVNNNNVERYIFQEEINLYYFDGYVSLSIDLSGYVLFAAVTPNKLRMIHYNFVLNTTDKEITINITSYVNTTPQVYYFLPDGIKEAFVISSNKVLLTYLTIASNNFPKCSNLCYERQQNEKIINFIFNKEFFGQIVFSSIILKYGNIMSNYAKNLKPNSSYSIIVNNFSYNVIDANEIGMDSFEYSTGLIDIDNASTCTVKIFNNDVNYPCACEGDKVGKILHKFEDSCIEDCPEFSLLEFSNNTCYFCKDLGQFWYQGKCIDEDKLPISTYISNELYNVVNDCDGSCRTCANNEICTSCNTGFDLIINKCVKTDKTYSVELVVISTENENIVISSIQFDECESILREYYGISNTEELRFVKIDENKEESLNTFHRYKAYAQNQTELNMFLCKDVKMKVTYKLISPSPLMCENLCLDRPKNEQYINIKFNEEFFGPVYFSITNLKFGRLLNNINDKFEEIEDNICYFVESLNLVYYVTNLSETQTDSFEYSSGIEQSGTSAYTIIILNGVSSPSLPCACESEINNIILYKYNDQCIEQCPEFSVIINNTCYNCKVLNQYLYHEHCVEKKDLPISTYISNETINSVEDCDISCRTCIDAPTHCISCNSRYDLLIDHCTPAKYPGYSEEISDISTTNLNILILKINFDECENVLRTNYNINPSDEIKFVKKPFNEYPLDNYLSYNVYSPNRDEWNMSLCNQTKLIVTYSIQSPSIIDIEYAKQFEDLGIDVFNAKDPFFNEICFPFLTSNKRDVTLSDRKNDFYKNVSLCEKGCIYNGINLNNFEVDCICNIEELEEPEINLNFFLSTFKKIFIESNFAVVKCYKLVIDKKKIPKNYGEIIFFFFVLVHLPLFIVYCYNGLNPIRFALQAKNANPIRNYRERREGEKGNSKEKKKNPLNRNNNRNDDIENIEDAKKEQKNNIVFQNEFSYYGSLNEINNENYQDVPLKNYQKVSLNMNDNSVNASRLILKSNAINKREKENRKKKQRQNKKIIMLIKKSRFFNSSKNSIYSSTNENFINSNKMESPPLKQKKSKKYQLNKPKKSNLCLSNTKLKKSDQNIGFCTSKNTSIPTPSNDYLDDFDFDSAILYDNRGFLRIYYLTLLTKQPILHVFVFKSPLEIKVMRITNFFFCICLDFSLSALFYKDSLISKRYHYKGKAGFLFNLQSNIVESIVSCVVGVFLSTVLNFLSNSKKGLKEIQNQEDKEKVEKVKEKILKILRVKISFYIIIEFLLMVFFWYFVSCFCAVFMGSQVSWLEGGFTSLLITQIAPFGITFVITIIRVIAVKRKMKALFQISIFFYQI